MKCPQQIQLINAHALMCIKLHLQLDHLALWGMTISVTLAVRIAGHVPYMQTIPCGMEPAVGLPTPVAL